MSDEQTASASHGGDQAPLVLRGHKVLDLSTHACGPFATQVLAGLGATVLKLERPPTGDPERRTERPMFVACNGGKYSIAEDLKTAGPTPILRQLVAGADVVVEGFRPGVAERLGLGFDDVRALQPTVVYVSLPGFGSHGPYADRRGFDVEYRAIAGDIYLNRDRDGLPTYAEASPAFDFAAGMYAVVGILGALLERTRGALHIDVPILAAGLAWSYARLIDPTRRDGSHSAIQPVYRASDGLYLTVTASMDEHFQALCAVIDRPDLATSPDLSSFVGRRGRRREIDQAISERVALHPREHWLATFTAAGVATAPVLSPDEVFQDPQVRWLDVIGEEPEPWTRLPISGMRSRRLRRPPEVDEHGDLVRQGGWEALVALDQDR